LDDKDLELLKTKKILSLRKNLVSKKIVQTNRDVLIRKLGYRGQEVLESAERSYPKETAVIIDKIAEMIKKGILLGEISGGELLSLFRKIGMNVHVETKFAIKEHGRLISLSDKLKDSND
jgi:hypothetical protein